MRALYIFPQILFLALLLTSCDKNQNEENSLQGYVEGRQLNLAARANGIITALAVEEGDNVTAGTLLFSVDAIRAKAQLDASISAKSAAEAQLADLKKGGRPAEIKATTENLRAAQADLTLAQKNYARSKNLVVRGNTPVAILDRDKAIMDSAKARVTEANSRLSLIQLPARSDAIVAAQHEVDIRTDTVTRTLEDLKDRSIIAPVSGRIETIYRRIGEITGPTQPVLSLLPQDQKKIRFFVPEPLLSRIHYGDLVSIQCDNCTDGLQAKITFISGQAEFTPPIIFTKTERAKLVYRVDATPEHPEYFLNGQPISVTLMTKDSKTTENSKP